MSRKSKSEISNEIPQLNLGPIMNMVVILIPLLLLSVVFTEVGVINITAPKMAMGAATETPPDKEEEPLNLTINVEERGIRIMYHSQALPPISGCPSDAGAPTVCLNDSSQSALQTLQAAVQKLKSTDNAAKKEGANDLKTAVNLYNWRELYNQLSKIKDEFPDETVINISAEPTMPYSVIVRAMDVSRYKLEKKSYDNNEEFWTASFIKDGNSYAALFPDPVLNLPK